jgi:hypothetical protein
MPLAGAGHGPSELTAYGRLAPLAGADRSYGLLELPARQLRVPPFAAAILAFVIWKLASVARRRKRLRYSPFKTTADARANVAFL